MSYKYVDLRGRYCSADSNWDSHSNDLGTVKHYYGPGDALNWANRDILGYIKAIINGHMTVGRFAAGWWFNGSAYHEFIHEDTVYQVRNYQAVLPHCGNKAWNYRSIAIHIPVGVGQRASARTLQTLAERTSDHLKALSLNRNSAVGHQEVGASECPGLLMDDFVRPYRAGKNFGTSTPVPPDSGKVVSRWEFCRAPVDSLTGHASITYDGEVIGSFVPGGPSHAQDYPRWKFCDAPVYDLKRSRLDITYANKIIGTFKGSLHTGGEDEPVVNDVERFITFARRLLGTQYGSGWAAGTWPDGPSLYARCNPNIHTVEFIRRNPMICSAFVNVVRAHVFGEPAIGRKQGDGWPGGTAAVGRTLARMAGSRPYIPGETPKRGDMLYSPYLGPALVKQGHVGWSLGNGKVLEARPPAASENRSVQEVHNILHRNAGVGWTHVVPFKVWSRG